VPGVIARQRFCRFCAVLESVNSTSLRETRSDRRRDASETLARSRLAEQVHQ
jgi:hypothetical protein